ncbi:hypothetical protein L7F22_013926 [Adiantum nelumboides]|nr:hypothetical protein [Adiantum nelumboides]
MAAALADYIKHAPVISPQLLALFPHLVAVMDRNSEHLQHLLCIFLDGVIGNVNEKGMMCSLPVVEMLIQCFPNDAPGLLERILQKLLKIVIVGTGEADTVRASAGAVLARILVQNSLFFAQWISQPSLVSMLGQFSSKTSENLLFTYIDSWLEKVDFLTTIPRKKICALALCVLLTTKEPEVLERLEQILSVCTTLVHQTDESSGEGALSYDYLLPTVQHEERSSENEELRWRQILAADPINKLAVVPLLKERLQTCSSVHGEAALNAALSKMHPSLLNQLQQLLGT